MRAWRLELATIQQPTSRLARLRCRIIGLRWRTQFPPVAPQAPHVTRLQVLNPALRYLVSAGFDESGRKTTG